MAIVLIGFMGAGKSTAARDAATTLATTVVDVDELLENRLGKSISAVFEEEGEAAFRAAEEELTLELLDQDPRAVLALGGGAPTAARVREVLADPRHRVIWMDVDLETAWRRAGGSARPLARDRGLFEHLYRAREPVYMTLADAVVPSGCAERMAPVLEALVELPLGTRMLWATSAGGDYPAYIGPGLLEGFWPRWLPSRRFVVSDGNVARRYASALEPVAGLVTIMPGEQSKTVAHADVVWNELARAGMTRSDILVALGGGVVGDLAGFCAATYQRGVSYVQAPTTLVAQVDSAYGGKTGIDLVEAKNYVGAYHQPRAVIADTDALGTLPAEELAAGAAEVIKTALIAGGELWERVQAGEDPARPEIVTACALTKLRIVAQDERDSGLRQVLNLGHTVGHAIEAATGYAAYRHGEAVALGLLAALRLSEQDDLRAIVAELLSSHGLPTRLERADPDAVVMATARDKKRRGTGEVPFVLLDEPGRARPGCPIPSRQLLAAVRELSG
jgi:shikimate kinase / 3-dehydroquinate synthase